MSSDARSTVLDAVSDAISNVSIEHNSYKSNFTHEHTSSAVDTSSDVVNLGNVTQVGRFFSQVLIYAVVLWGRRWAQHSTDEECSQAVIHLLGPCSAPGYDSRQSLVRRSIHCKRCMLLRTFEYKMITIGRACADCKEIRRTCEAAMEDFGGASIQQLRLCDAHMIQIEQDPTEHRHRCGSWDLFLSMRCDSSCELCYYEIPFKGLLLLTCIGWVGLNIYKNGKEAEAMSKESATQEVTFKVNISGPMKAHK